MFCTDGDLRLILGQGILGKHRLNLRDRVIVVLAALRFF
jgi:hypothetical protein